MRTRVANEREALAALKKKLAARTRELAEALQRQTATSDQCRQLEERDRPDSGWATL
jgi:hypothetical protein